jgi:hypothetical protein
MPSVTGGGASNISGAQITDGSISNADIASNAAIDYTKLAGIVGNPAAFFSVEESTAATYDVTTVANQKLIVMANCGNDGAAGTTITVSLKYGGVTKGTSTAGNGNSRPDNCVVWATFTPGAGTATLSLSPSTGSLNNQRWLIFKLMIA